MKVQVEWGVSIPSSSFIDVEKWSQLDDERKEVHIFKLLNNVESAKRATRMKAARAILYLAQGIIQNACMFILINREFHELKKYYVDRSGSSEGVFSQPPPSPS